MGCMKHLGLLFVLLLSLNAHAQSVFVEPATGSGVSESDLATTTSLVQTSVSDVSSDSVADSPDKADLSLRPKLMRLGDSYILSLAKIKNGAVIFSSQLKAAQMDELDKVAERLTRSVLQGQRGKDGTRVGEITNEEAREGTQRKPVRKEWYVGLGGSEFGNLNSTGVGYSFGLAYGWDVNTALIKIMGEGDFNGSAFFTSVGIGGEYFLTTDDFAPYIGADFGVGLAKVDQSFLSGQTVGGFVVGVGPGVELLRTSSINLDLNFRAGFLLHENNLGDPRVLALRLGLYF
jgi:hypothetical protein